MEINFGATTMEVGCTRDEIQRMKGERLRLVAVRSPQGTLRLEIAPAGRPGDIYIANASHFEAGRIKGELLTIILPRVTTILEMIAQDRDSNARAKATT